MKVGDTVKLKRGKTLFIVTGVNGKKITIMSINKPHRQDRLETSLELVEKGDNKELIEKLKQEVVLKQREGAKFGLSNINDPVSTSTFC